MWTKSRTVTCSESRVSRYWMTMSNAESRVLLCLPEHDFFSCRLFAPKHLWDLTERKFEKQALWYTTSWATQSCKNSIFTLSRTYSQHCLFKLYCLHSLQLSDWSFSSFSQNKHFGLESSDLGCLLFSGDLSFNVFFSLLTGKIYASTSCYSQSDSVFLVKKILFADDSDLFRMPLRMRNNDTMNV